MMNAEDKIRMVICPKCKKKIHNGLLLAHLGKEHGLDVMNYMKFWKTWRGLTWTSLIFAIGVILGILVRGLV